ncbi:MAG: hypothetical protein Q8Q62_11070 [Mesorhizobium sp.]|nr:hypothetical protein [Mesorhizobium sp.]
MVFTQSKACIAALEQKIEARSDLSGAEVDDMIVWLKDFARTQGNSGSFLRANRERSVYLMPSEERLRGHGGVALLIVVEHGEIVAVEIIDSDVWFARRQQEIRKIEIELGI